MGEKEHLQVPIGNAGKLDRVFNAPQRFKVVTKGRRVGVTRSKANHLTGLCLSGQPYRFLWVDTVHRNIDRYFERFFLPILKVLDSKDWGWNGQKKTLHIHDAIIDFGSVERAENLEGFGYHEMFLNEAGIILAGANGDGQRLWDESLRPMVADTGGGALIAGVPKGIRNNFFPELWERAGTLPDWGRWKLTSYDSPYLPKDEVDTMVSEMRPRTARQEIFAEFVDIAETDRPWLTELSDDHFSADAVYRPGMPVVVSVDFNIDPMVATLHHLWRDKTGHHWHTFAEVVMQNASVPAFAQLLRGKLERLGADVLRKILVTGDATASKRDINRIDHRPAWKTIQKELRVSDARMKVPRVNPSVSDCRELCNSVLFSHPDVKVNPECKTLVFEMQYTEADEDGRIPKKNRARLEQRADALDTWRYVPSSFMVDYIDNPRKYRPGDK